MKNIKKSYKKSYKNNKFKHQAQWSYSPSGIQDYFQNIIKNHNKVTDNPPIRIYVNKIESRVIFRIITKYYLELLMPEMINAFYSEALKIR